MFTGIVRERARTVSFGDRRLVVESSLSTAVGDSVNVDGVCLTVVEAQNGRLAFDLMDETLARTKGFGDAVNLEPALAAGEPLGGHYVQGHVDGVGRVRAFEGERLTVEAPPEILRYCVEKGSIAVDGVSLTIAEIDAESFTVALVAHTLEVTTLGRLEPGDPVNLEVDILAKYVEKLVGSSP
ncbi:MAG TPA: riboflavin synthase [Gaiellaceae bacterium]|nr:riboflavin synthase [Gaiellaceae bacterium]